MGIGFVIEPEEARILVEKSIRNKEVLLPYINGEDLNTRTDQSASRWVIYFRDWILEQAEAYTDCIKIVRERVKPEREKQKDKIAKETWWKFFRTRPELYNAISGMRRVLITSRVSAHHFFAFAPTNQIFSDRLVVIAASDFANFTLLSSGVHEVWAHRPGTTTHETRNTYFPVESFETFPFPTSLTGLDVIGETYHEHRRQIMLVRQEGLTKTYNRFHDPAESSDDIAELRRLHVAMDQAVAAAYGWADLDLGHGFHITKQGLRYTISEPARRTVLDRLLAVNHQRYAEEVAQGLHDKGAKNGTGKGKRGKQVAEGQGELF